MNGEEGQRRTTRVRRRVTSGGSLDSEEEDDEEEEEEAAGAAGRAVVFSRGMKCNRVRAEGLVLSALECVWCSFMDSKQRGERGSPDSLMD